jgi:hypothetical protein
MKHNCCDLCAKACSCGERSCPANVLPAATTEFDRGQTRIRDVTAKQKHELTQKLIVLRKELNIPLFEKCMGYSGKIHPAELHYSSTSSLPFKLTRFWVVFIPSFLLMTMFHM